MKKLKGFFISYSAIVAFFAVAYVIIYRILPEFSPRFLEALVLAAVPVCIISTLLYRVGMSNRMLWVCRLIDVFQTCFFLQTFLYLYGFRHEEPVWMLVSWGGGLLVAIALAIIAFFIADRLEKKHLQKINEKLKENE